MDFERITYNQLGMLSHLFREREWREGDDRKRLRDWIPEAWSQRVGMPEADWRLWNMERWMEANLSKRAASAIIAALTEENYDGARTILEANKFPTKQPYERSATEDASHPEAAPSNR